MTLLNDHQRQAASPFGSFLDGVRIVDLSQYIPGPMATLFLADMGAEVLKVESPKGDEMQLLGPKDEAGRPIFYRALNAGKVVRRIDLKSDSGRAVFLELIKEADVVVEGFRPGVLKRLGIDYPALKAANSRIILCSISGYGIGSGLAQKAGHDANYLAQMGVVYRNGGEMPSYYDPPVSDVAGSLFAATAILGALYRLRATEKGCMIDLALVDTVMPLQLMQVADFGARGMVPGRGETYLNGGAAYYQVYATRDAHHVVIGAVEPKFWSAFCNAVGHPEWIARQGEALPQLALIRDVADYLGSKTVDELMECLCGIDCCFSPVHDLREALLSRHVAERQLVRCSAEGELQALFPVWVDGVPPQSRMSIVDVSLDEAKATSGASSGEGRETSCSTRKR